MKVFAFYKKFLFFVVLLVSSLYWADVPAETGTIKMKVKNDIESKKSFGITFCKSERGPCQLLKPKTQVVMIPKTSIYASKSYLELFVTVQIDSLDNKLNFPVQCVTKTSGDITNIYSRDFTMHLTGTVKPKDRYPKLPDINDVRCIIKVYGNKGAD